MPQIESINLKVCSDGSAYLIEQGLTTRERPIDPQSLLAIIESSIINKVTDRYESVLPKNCIYYGVLERHSLEPQQIVVVEREPCIRPYNHLGTMYRVGYPKLLFAYKISKNRVNGSFVVAATDEYIKEGSNCYHFPYANVGPHGGICTGNYIYPQLNEVADVALLPEGFYLIEHTHITNAANQIIEELLEKTQEKVFDNNLLVFKQTFKQFVDTITN